MGRARKIKRVVASIDDQLKEPANRRPFETPLYVTAFAFCG
jgi:hypothetical protein